MRLEVAALREKNCCEGATKVVSKDKTQCKRAIRVTKLTCADSFFDKVYNREGVVKVSRTRHIIKLEIPVRRAKGSQGDITVQWSLYQNESSHSTNLLWPTSGIISLADGEWNESFIVNVENNKKEAPESVIWIQLDKTTGGAVLGSRDQTTAKIVIAGNEEGETPKWTVIGACSAFLLVLAIVVVLLLVRRRVIKSAR